MMGRLNRDQRQLFYEFCLDEVVPDDHLVRQINSVLDLSWACAELASYYSSTGRPSIDPVLMIRMLIVGIYYANNYLIDVKVGIIVDVEATRAIRQGDQSQVLPRMAYPDLPVTYAACAALRAMSPRPAASASSATARTARRSRGSWSGRTWSTPPAERTSSRCRPGA